MRASPDDAGGVRWLLVHELLAPPEEVARTILDEHRGERVVTDDERLVALLVDAGGTIQRRGHDYEHDLADVPPPPRPPDGWTIGHDLDPAGLVEAHELANPPGHPDHELTLDHLADLTDMAGGKVLGPLVRQASWQVSDERGPQGAVMVVERTPGRGWVVDVFVHPGHQGKGLGRLLMLHAVSGAKQAGLATLGLVVTDGNPARALYDATGFRHIRSGTNVDVPLLS